MQMIGIAYSPAESSAATILNFQSGFSSQCFEKIIQNQDLYQARERISKHQREGSDVKERSSKHARLSAGNHMKAGTNRTCKCAYELIVEHFVKKERIEKEKIDTVRREWERILKEANELLPQHKYKSRSTTKDCIVVLKSSRRSKDENIPKLKITLCCCMTNRKQGDHLL